MIFDSYDLKTGNEILLERPFGLKGCTSIVILQNWRDILTVEEKATSGTRASDVWTKPVMYNITVKEMNKWLMEEIIDPYGDEITIVGSL